MRAASGLPVARSTLGGMSGARARGVRGGLLRGAWMVSRRMFVQGDGAAQSWAAYATRLRAVCGAQRAPTNGPDGNRARVNAGCAQPHTRAPSGPLSPHLVRRGDATSE